MGVDVPCTVRGKQVSAAQLKGCLRSLRAPGSADAFYAALVSEAAWDAFLLRLGAGRRRGLRCRPLLPVQRKKPDTEAGI